MRGMRRHLIFIFLLLFASAPLHAQSTVSDLNEAGWKALEAGNTRKALLIFNEALTLRPNDPVLLTGAGAALQADGRPRDAMARLQKAVSLRPELKVASLLLGQIAFAEGDSALAIKTYEAALKHAPNDPVLLSSLAEWKRESKVHSTFEEQRYDRFRVMFEGRAEQATAAQAVAILNRAFWKIGEKLGSYPSETIVTVLYTEQQFRDVTHAPEWSVGQFDGRIRIPVAGASRQPALFEQVLVHELVHAIIDAIAGPRVPSWLHEGLAQYFEGSDPAAARRRLRAAGVRIPLRDLERGFDRLNAAQAQVAYDESLLAVGVMLERPGFGWNNLLGRLSGGQSFQEAIPNFGLSYADLEAAFR
jgi:tetratricopeptide (TPR) repeat protein